MLAHATVGGVTGMRIHRNMNNVALVPQAPLTAQNSGSPIDYYDVTGDGRLDWINATLSGGLITLNYAPQNADGSFGANVPILTHTTENQLNNSYRLFGDFNGDGRVDIAYFPSGNSNWIRVLRNTGGGNFVLGNEQSAPGIFFGYIADMNNDGRSDIVSDTNTTFKVFFGQSDSTFQTVTQAVTNAQLNGGFMPPRDFNNDGRLDLIYVDDNRYEVFINNPGGGFTSQYYPVRLRSPFPIIYLHFEDFNADGKADLWERGHDVFNTFNEEVVVVKTSFCDPKGQTRAANFNSDGTYPDVVVWNGATGDFRSKDGEFTSADSLPTQTFNWGHGSHGDIPALGDFDGDGRTDHTVYRNSTGTWYTFMSATASWFVFRFGLSGDIPIPNDYDGGGKSDIAVFRPSDGNWYIWHMETQSFAAYHWGADGDRPVPADFDGDGKTDIAVFRPSNGGWYYTRSSDMNAVIFQWGLSGDIPLPADYDGDGKADIAVYRSGIWYIHRSMNGTYGIFNWGTTGDIPLPFVQKGDVAAAVVYRPGNSRFYNSRFPLGWAITLSGGSPVYFGLPNN